MATTHEPVQQRARIFGFLSTHTPPWFGVLVFLWFGVGIGVSYQGRGAIVAALVVTVVVLVLEAVISVIKRGMSRE
ncbi:MAG TPA: hypothetical protein PKE34_01400 [Marmoricola sp.]|nr:hypothetical protein [Marmoricola sp.]